MSALGVLCFTQVNLIQDLDGFLIIVIAPENSVCREAEVDDTAALHPFEQYVNLTLVVIVGILLTGIFKASTLVWADICIYWTTLTSDAPA